MDSKRFSLLAAALLIPLSLGCVTESTSFRGQDPGLPPGLPLEASDSGDQVQACQPGAQCQDPNCPNCQHSHGHIAPLRTVWANIHHHLGGAYYGAHAYTGIPPMGGIGGRHFHGDKEPVGDWYPTHNFSYHYHKPKNLTYPTTGIPAGVVQYPYYTVKGPSCFFMQ